MIIFAIVDKPSFRKHLDKMDVTAHKYLLTLLEYYGVITPAVHIPITTHPGMELNYRDIDIIRLCGRKDGKKYAIWDPKIHRYSLHHQDSCDRDIQIGFAPLKCFDVLEDNSNSCGWYMDLRDYRLYSQDKPYDPSAKPYAQLLEYDENWINEIFTCIYNASTREISFERNGVPLGVAFSNVVGEDIAPAVQLAGCENDTLFLSQCYERMNPNDCTQS
jgi:hypothetical protein